MALPLIVNEKVEVVWSGVFGDGYSVHEMKMIYDLVSAQLLLEDDRAEKKSLRLFKRKLELSVLRSQQIFYSPKQLEKLKR